MRQVGDLICGILMSPLIKVHVPGDRGLTGPAGPTGSKGSKGDQGNTGLNGALGKEGKISLDPSDTLPILIT